MDFGKLPAGFDEVTVGDVDRSRSHHVKVIFIIGLNDGSFPSANREEGFLNDSDREVLRENGLELAKTTLENLYDDAFNIYKAFATSEEKLYLSYVSSDQDGTPQKPSTLLIKLKKIFPKLKEESDIIEQKLEVSKKAAIFEELLLQIRDLKDGKEIDEQWLAIYQILADDQDWKGKLKQAMQGLDFSNEPNKISQANIQKLYGDTLKTSVSKLENYQKCAFSFYLTYGLKLKEKENYQLENLDTGSFMHDVIDSFFTELEARRHRFNIFRR